MRGLAAAELVVDDDWRRSVCGHGLEGKQIVVADTWTAMKTDERRTGWSECSKEFVPLTIVRFDS